MSKIVEVSCEFTLYDLCDFILDSFEFEDDHLHQYFIANAATDSGSFCHQQSIQDENLMLREIFPLGNNQALFMNFDFGDNWLFKMTEQKSTTRFDKNACYPRITKQTGNNPEQYPMYEGYE